MTFIFGVRSFVNFGIASDISEYIELIRKTDFDDNNKKYLTRRLESMRINARNGKHVDVMQWIESDEKFRRILHDKNINDVEYNQIINELDYLDRELKNND